MKKIILGLAAFAAAFAFPAAAPADLAKGATAPGFVTRGALNGKPFAFNLRAALKRGPVVLYFYPKSFTQGCTLEARAFAEAMGDFKAAGASVIGLSADDLATQIQFSAKECGDKFPIGVASPSIIKAYDVALAKPDGSATGLTKRTSYVIGQDGRIRLVHSDMDWRHHVHMTLDAVRALKR